MKHSPIMSLFLSQSYQDAYDGYMRSLNQEGFARWDYVALTASNERQAEEFRAQLDERRQAGFLPPETKFVVLPDPDGRRVGSGGATLGAISHIARQTGSADFSGLRMLVVHSGGDSKRVPQYSALGKLFSPVPRELPNGRASTLFDELMIATANVPMRIREGMMLLSGDALLLFNALQIDWSGEGAAAISFKESVETGKDHGVFLRGGNGNVKRFLHKQPIEALRRQGAVNSNGCVDIDTGAVVFSCRMVEALYGLVSVGGRPDEEAFGKFVNERIRLSLYGDFLYPLAEDSTLEAFYSEKAEVGLCDELKEARTKVWEVLRPFRMRLLRLAPAEFIHFGTTKEIMRLLTKDIGQYGYLGWSGKTNSSITGEGVAGYNSVLSSKAGRGKNCYLEVSYVHHNASIGDNTLLSYVDIHDAAVPSDVVLHGLKQKDGRFVVRIYGMDDNPKAELSKNASLFGRPLAGFMEENGLSAEDLWEGGDRSLWTARLYPVCATIGEAVDGALNLYRIAHGSGDIGAWLAQERASLESGLGEADPKALIAWSKRMEELVHMDRVGAMVRNKVPVSQARGFLNGGGLSPIQEEWLERRLRRVGWGEAVRLFYYIGSALGVKNGDRFVQKSFGRIRDAVVEGAPAPMRFDEGRRIAKDYCVVRLPLRVNFGGGWSDTPPYCLENGGTVLNAAITLNGALPIEVSIARTKELQIVFDSRDMDVHSEFETLEPLQRTGDPYDPFALQKAALAVCGIIPSEGGNLKEILARLGGGFMMRTEVTGVPKGSGLGTSSILAGACVKVLFEFMGIPYGQNELYSRVLCIEQLMSTGGGWQDQIGGLEPGIKYITTAPGLRQDFKVMKVEIAEETRRELEQRFALVYTGQRRLARNLLRDVIGRYIGNEPDSLFALNEVQRIAALMRFELERGRLDDFAVLMDRHWELSKKIDGGSANMLIDHIFASIEDLVAGRMICGAGGGGFLQVMLRPYVTREQVHQRLKSVFQDSDIDIWECALA